MKNEKKGRRNKTPVSFCAQTAIQCMECETCTISFQGTQENLIFSPIL